jgi:hypothetical protein
MDRREALQKMAGTLAAGAVDVKEAAARSADDEEPNYADDPAIYRAMCALLDFQEAADDFMTRHEIEEIPDMAECDCFLCHSFRGQLYWVDIMYDTFGGEIVWNNAGVVKRKEQWLGRRRKEFARMLRDAVKADAERYVP